MRRTLSAILWRHQNGAKWRSIPAELGPWWMAAQTFIRWSRLGVWEKLLALVQERQGVELGMVYLDGTTIRAQSKAAGARKKGGSGAERDRRQAFGRSRGGYGTKACGIADAAGRAIAFRLAPGQAHEAPHAAPLLEASPTAPKWVVADRGYTGHALRQKVWDMGARPAIPHLRTRLPSPARTGIYANRNRVERLWARLKEWRAIATRYEKTAQSFLSLLHFAAACDWIRH